MEPVVIEIDMRPSTAKTRPVTRERILEKPIDKRSNMIDRKVAPRQLLCYVCCAEFGTNSLPIHQKTCLKKHEWGLDSIANDQNVSKKQAVQNRRKCAEPGDAPVLPVPSAKCNPEAFDAYNAEAQQIFFSHAEACLWCRTQNVEAMEAARKAAEQKARQQEEAENLRRYLEEEEERQRRRLALEEEARRKALEDEEARRRGADEALKRTLAEEALKAAQGAVSDWLKSGTDLQQAKADAENAARRRAEEEKALQRVLEEEEAAAEERRKRLLAQGKHKFLRKGEGVQAAKESGNVFNAKELEEKAKHDIAYYSLNHAKKEGLIIQRSEAIEKPDVEYKEVEVDEAQWRSQWTAEEEIKFSQNLFGSAAETKGGYV